VAGKSTIDKQPPKARKIAERAARDPAATILSTTEAMNAAGAAVSKSSVGRWLKEAREQLDEYREAQEVARLWTKELSENPDGDTGVMISETLKLLAGRVVADLRRRSDEAAEGKENADPVSAQELMLAAKALDHVERADGGSLKRRVSAEQIALKRQAQAAEKVAKAKGLTREQWAAIRAEFLGIKPDASEPPPA
jgi:hypothetical protein